MNIWLLFLICTAFTACAARHKIILGETASKDQFPFQAKLLTKDQHFLCGGSIIHERWILTAAHCIARYIPVYIEVGNYHSYPHEPEGLYEILKHIKHNDYRTKKGHDIALLRTRKVIKFTPLISKIKLPANSLEMYADKWAIISGWGTIEGAEPPPRSIESCVLQYMITYVMDIETCQKMVKEEYNYEIIERHLCTETKYEKQVCYGDSGGPVTVNDTLVGIVAFTFKECESIVNVHTRVTSHLPWIHSILKNYGDVI